MDEKKEIINHIRSIAGRYSEYEVFVDWIRCGALAISNAVTPFRGKVWKEREKTYMDTINRYTKEEQKIFSKMFALLTLALEKEMGDVLGDIYMTSGMGSKAAGQFFTPYHLSKLCADLVALEPDGTGRYRINEPSCGGGGMIIAVAAALRDRGVDYQRKMDVVAQDIDIKSVYMCYLQLSLLGIKAVCVQGDTLKEAYINDYSLYCVLHTPAKMGEMAWMTRRG